MARVERKITIKARPRSSAKKQQTYLGRGQNSGSAPMRANEMAGIRSGSPTPSTEGTTSQFGGDPGSVNLGKAVPTDEELAANNDLNERYSKKAFGGSPRELGNAEHQQIARDRSDDIAPMREHELPDVLGASTTPNTEGTTLQFGGDPGSSNLANKPARARAEADHGPGAAGEPKQAGGSAQEQRGMAARLQKIKDDKRKRVKQIAESQKVPRAKIKGVKLLKKTLWNKIGPALIAAAPEIILGIVITLFVVFVIIYAAVEWPKTFKVAAWTGYISTSAMISAINAIGKLLLG